MKYVHHVNIKPIFKIWNEDICPIFEHFEDEERDKSKKKLEKILDLRLEEYNQAMNDVQKGSIVIQEYIPIICSREESCLLEKYFIDNS